MDLQQEQQQWWARLARGTHRLPPSRSQSSAHSPCTPLATDTHPNETSCILVPLCGKSKDLIWLQKHFHQVIGVELVPQAVKVFFEENQITPTHSFKKSLRNLSTQQPNLATGRYLPNELRTSGGSTDSSGL